MRTEKSKSHEHSLSLPDCRGFRCDSIVLMPASRRGWCGARSPFARREDRHHHPHRRPAGLQHHRGRQAAVAAVPPGAGTGRRCEAGREARRAERDAEIGRQSLGEPVRQEPQRAGSLQRIDPDAEGRRSHLWRGRPGVRRRRGLPHGSPQAARDGFLHRHARRHGVHFRRRRPGLGGLEQPGGPQPARRADSSARRNGGTCPTSSPG